MAAVTCALFTLTGYAVTHVAAGELKAGIDVFLAGALRVMPADSMVSEANDKAGNMAGLAAVLGFALAAALSNCRRETLTDERGVDVPVPVLVVQRAATTEDLQTLVAISSALRSATSNARHGDTLEALMTRSLDAGGRPVRRGLRGIHPSGGAAARRRPVLAAHPGRLRRYRVGDPRLPGVDRLSPDRR
ncbi:hypothetical protein [Micromonospora aurantiaca]|uniref:hypothetical protein n=1 Tax=Micromonospora aurantiaca (nom. illeg.) TaxID=47850 RepID=UPI00197C4A5E|nr:hypothetical protein [Micromonospora aurantiaca]